MTQQTKLKDFIPYPRKIVEDHDKGKLTGQEYSLVDLIWKKTNPYNGYYQASYISLIKELRLTIKEATMRKRVSDLRKKQYIYFKDHKGQTGTFPIYPLNFMRTNGFIQTLEYLEKESKVTTEPQPTLLPTSQQGNNPDSQNHNLNQARSELNKRFSTHSQLGKATTPYIETHTHTHTKSITLKEKRSSGEYGTRDFSRPISPEYFMPQNSDEELCWTIAQKLPDKDMRFLLSRLKKYGYNFLKHSWEEFQNMPKDKMDNPASVFNRFLDKKAKEVGTY